MGLLRFCSSVVKTEPPNKLESYASAIAREATAAQTIQKLARSLALSDKHDVRKFVADILRYCSHDDEFLIKILLWLTADTNKAVSDSAYDALGFHYGNSQFVTELTNTALRSNVIAVRVAGASILAKTELRPKVLQTLLLLLQDEKWQLRELSARALGKSRDRRVVRPLIQLLKDDDDDVRQTAIEALAKLGVTQANRQLFSILRNEDDAVRTSAARALAVLGNKRQVIKELLPLLKDDDWEVRQSAVEALGQLKAASAMESLLETLRDADYDVRQSAVTVLGTLGNSRAIEPLLRSLRDQNENVRNSAAQAILRITGTGSSAVLTRALEGKSRLVRQRASEALGQAGDQRALTQLLRALRYKDPEARRNAAKGIGAVCDSRGVKPLVKALRDSDSGVRQNAARALGQIGHKDAVVPLLRTLNDSDHNVITTAVDALAGLGQSARAIKALIKSLRATSTPANGFSVAQGLGRIAQGDVRLIHELVELGKTENIDTRYSISFSVKTLAPADPKSASEFALTNLRETAPGMHERTLFLEILGRCAFLGEENAVHAIEEFANSQHSIDRIGSAALFGELLPILKQQPLEVLTTLSEDSDWTVRETLGRPLTRRTVFFYDRIAVPLDRLLADDEIAVALATSAASSRWTGWSTATESPRVLRYMNNIWRSRLFDQWFYQENWRSQGGFDPFVHVRPLDDLSLLRNIRRFAPMLLKAGESTNSETETARRRSSVDLKAVDAALRQIEQSSQVNKNELVSLEKLLHILPDPFVFYLVFKAAPTESSRAVRRLFYEIASLVEKVESMEIVKRRRTDSRLRRLLPELLEQLEKGFRKLEPSEFTEAYAAEFSSLRRLLTVSSLPEIPIAVAASERELTSIKGERIRPRSRQIWRTFHQVVKAIEPLRQYSDDAPLSLRTVPLSEAISNLEAATRVIGFESPEPYRTIFLQILSTWRELLSSAIRRQEGEARLVFSTLEEVAPGETISVVLEIRNQGPGPATNIQVKLNGKGLAEVKPEDHRLAALAQNESQTLLFTAKSRVSNLIVEFVATYDDLLTKGNIKTHSASIAVRTAEQVWKKILNPYLPGKPDPNLEQFEKLFVGREDVISFILDNLIGSAAERIIVLYGHRRTGKTWTLLRLRDRLPDIYVPIYIDMQAYSGVPGAPALLQNFAQRIFDGLKEVVNRKKLQSVYIPILEDYEKNYPYYFESRFLATIENVLNGRKLLWLIDEFQALEDMVSRNQLEPTFMEFLRHLMQFGKMVFVFAGTREVTGKYWSVFFNIAVQRKIGVLSDSDAAKLVIDPVRVAGVRHDRFAVPLIKQLTGNHPYYIQLLCDKVVVQLNTHKQMLVNAQVIEEAVNELVIPGTSNVKFYWDEVMDDRERAVAGAMQEISRRKQSTNIKTIWTEFTSINPRITAQNITATLKTLTDKDLLEKTRAGLDTYKFRIGLVERYIGAHVPYADTQERIGRSW